MPTHANRYDEFPYPSYSYEITHPDNLATIARLFGLSPAPVEQCRVLELGCASGGNILPMAANLPDSTFLGVDLSTRLIADGIERRDQLGLQNIELRHLDIMDVGPDLGTFDYILCHGVFSWVPVPVQDRILSIFKENLAETGIACVSYNIYPGWHQAGMLRSLLRQNIDPDLAPSEQVTLARQLLTYFVTTALDRDDTRLPFLSKELDRLNLLDDAYIFYEYLEGENHPCHFYELMTRADGHGLQYVGNGRRATMFFGNYPPVVAETLKACRGVIEAQQYLDFFRNYRFKTTLLCHADQPVDMNLSPERVYPLHAHADIEMEPANGPIDADSEIEVTSMRNRSATVTGRPIRLALSLLEDESPTSIPIERLLDQVVEQLRSENETLTNPEQLEQFRSELTAQLVTLYFGNIIELHSHPAPVLNRVSDHPRASELARIQAANVEFVANQWHQTRQRNAFTCAVLQRLDGSVDRDMLTEDIERAVRAGEVSLPHESDADRNLGELVGKTLETLRREALLIG